MKRKYRVRTVYHDTANGYNKEYYIQKRIDFHWFSYWIKISNSSSDGEQVLKDCIDNKKEIPQRVYIHSWNKTGARNIESLFTTYEKLYRRT
jgi:hypothetical protein